MWRFTRSTCVHNARYVDIMGRRISPAGAAGRSDTVSDRRLVPGAGLAADVRVRQQPLSRRVERPRPHALLLAASLHGGTGFREAARRHSFCARAAERRRWRFARRYTAGRPSPARSAVRSIAWMQLDDSTAWAGTDNTYQLRYNGTSWTQLFNVVHREPTSHSGRTRRTT